MKKIIKKWGDSLVIRFSPEECEIHDLEKGRVIDFTITRNGEKEVKNEKNKKTRDIA